MIRPLLRALAVLAALAAPAAAEIVSIEAVQPEARVGLDGAGMLSIRGQAGTDSALDVLYFFSFD